MTPERSIPPEYSEFLVWLNLRRTYSTEDAQAALRTLGSAVEMTQGGVWWLFSRTATSRSVLDALEAALPGAGVVVGDVRIESGAVVWGGLDLHGATDDRIESAWAAFTQGRSETYPA